MISFKNTFRVTEASMKVYSFSKRRPHLVLGTKSPQWPWLLLSNIHIPGSGLLFEANSNCAKPYSVWMILSMHRKEADINADWPRLIGSDLVGQEIKQITKYPPPPQGKKKSPKNRWHQACKMGEKEIPMGFHHLSWKCISQYVSAMWNSCQCLYFDETPIIFFQVFIPTFTCLLLLGNLYLPPKFENWPKKYDHKANKHKKMAPVYFINICCTN